MIKPFSEPNLGSSPPQGNGPVTTTNGNGSSDRERYRRRIADMISGVSSEMATKKTPTRPTDQRLLKARFQNSIVATASDTDVASSIPSGMSRSSSRNSLNNLVAHGLTGSQTSLASISHKSDTSSSHTVTPTSNSNNFIQNTAASHSGTPTSKPYPYRVNLAALLNDPRPGKRPVDVFSRLYGEAFERTASAPIPPLQGPQYQDNSKKDLAKYVKTMKVNFPLHKYFKKSYIWSIFQR